MLQAIADDYSVNPIGFQWTWIIPACLLATWIRKTFSRQRTFTILVITTAN